jgi:Cu(I)/Ag(I) efflux system membrane protein CusA/SilA
MIAAIIRWSIQNRPFIILATILLIISGVYILKQTPLDAIPDLSDVQVIIKSTYPGQAPQIVEEQVTSQAQLLCEASLVLANRIFI